MEQFGSIFLFVLRKFTEMQNLHDFKRKKIDTRKRGKEGPIQDKVHQKRTVFTGILR